MFVQGRDAPRRVAELARLGAEPLFAVGTTDEAGRRLRDPLFPDVPDLMELSGGLAAAPLHAAWCATAAAAQLNTALVLPAATPAALVALWRRGGDQGLAEPALLEAAAAMPARPVATAGAARALAAIATDAPALLELRRWLAERLGWRPS